MFLDPSSQATALARLEFYISESCKPFAQKHGLLISISEARLVDVLASARSTSEFHNIDPSRLSLYKEFAHIAYWIVQHKPISILTPNTKKMLLDGAADVIKAKLKQAVSGFDVRVVERIIADQD